MADKAKHNEKTIEQRDYMLKVQKKFPPDDQFPQTEQSKQNRNKKPIDKSKSARKTNKIEQNPGTARSKKQSRIYSTS